MDTIRIIRCGYSSVLALFVSGVLVTASASTLTWPGAGVLQEGGAARAQNVERVATVEGITEYRLPNGLRVLLFPDQIGDIDRDSLL